MLAVLVEHRLGTERQTHDYSIYRASMASCSKKTEAEGLEWITQVHLENSG